MDALKMIAEFLKIYQFFFSKIVLDLFCIAGTKLMMMFTCIPIQ